MVRPVKGKRGRRLRPSVRNPKRERVLEIIRQHVVEASRVVATYQRGRITVEGVATQLRLQPSKVFWAFMALNREGWLTQGSNHAPHDSPRDHFTGGGDSAWNATYYYLKKQKVQSGREQREVIPEPPFNRPVGRAVFVWDEEVPPRKKRYSKRLQGRVG